ncbi:MAG: cation:proton antiporter [Acidimicrobiia bacterium]
MSGGLLLAVLFAAYALFSRRLSRSSFTGPMLFTAVGLFAAWVTLEEGALLSSFALQLESDVVQTLLEGTLVIIPFSDAALIDVRRVRRTAFLPTRLLLIGLPLTMVLGTVIAMLLVPGIGLWPAAIIAIILSPTDAALGQAVVANEEVPDLVRQGLGIESGLNDGLVVPFLAIALAAANSEMQTASEILDLFVKEIGFAVAVGAAIGWFGAWAARHATARGWIGREGRQVLVVFLAILCAIAAEQVHGSAFIAAFVGGMVFGEGVRRSFPDICHFSEGVGHLMTMLTFFVFGGLILYPTLGIVGWQALLYAILSLTVIRIIPVLISLVGTDLELPTKLYIGWFGPRGLASLVFMGTVIVSSDPSFAPTVFKVGATTVGLSVLLHGITAWPASNRYASWYNRAEDMSEDDMVESSDVEMMPGRRLDGRFGMAGDLDDD